MSDRSQIALQLLGIVKAIHDGGRDIIGEKWGLYRKMSAFAERADVAGMAAYFDECLKSERGKRVAHKLKAAGRKTLESEAPLFLRTVADCITDSKLSYHRGAGRPQSRGVDPMDELLTRDSIAAKLEEALTVRLRRMGGDGRKRLQALPVTTLRHTPPELENAGRYLRDAALCYVLTLYDGAAVLSRAALEVILQERLRSRSTWLQRTPESLQSLIDRAGKILTHEQTREAETIKNIGDRAAHGDHATAASAHDALVRLKRLIRALYN